jgi:hypothetical protein
MRHALPGADLDLREVRDHIHHTPLLGLLSSSLKRININSRCSRTPGTTPFASRRTSVSSAAGVGGLSAYTDALKTVDINETIIREAELELFFQPKR